jgi:hypothetical protein
MWDMKQRETETDFLQRSNVHGLCLGQLALVGVEVT